MRNIERIEGRNIWLDLLKGITIILVIIGHILSGANGKSILHNHYLAKSIDDAIGVFHMPMFFLLSGIAFSYIKNRKNKIVENSINILLLYVIWSCVMYLLKELFPQIINVAYDDSLIVCLLYKPISPYWYFLVLFEYYIMHVLFDKIHIKYLELVFAVVISGLAPVFWSIGPDKTSSYIFRALFHFVFFYYGILFVDLYKNERLKGISMILSKKSMFPILLICLGISLSIIARFLNDLFVFPLVKTLYVSILLFSLLLGSLGFFKRINESKSFIIEFFSYLGLNVVYYYVLHNYLTVAFRFVYTHMGISVPDAIYVSMNLFFTIIVCSAVAQVCKKYHIFNIVFMPIKEIKRIRQRTKNPVA